METCSEQIVNINGKSLYVRKSSLHLDDGQKPWLIFLHQGLGCSAQWFGFTEKLSELTGCPALEYDRYGYGLSDSVEADPRPVDFLHREAYSYLPKVLTANGLNKRKIILFGHSDGGTIALLYASLRPEYLTCIITEAAHVMIEAVTRKGIEDVIKTYDEKDLHASLAKYHGEKTDSMFRSWSRGWLSDAFLNWNIEKDLMTIKCPVLAIQGTEDDYGTPLQLESIRKNSKGPVDLSLIESCGHVPHYQAKDVVTKETLRFLYKYHILN
jgi:pimeloyl-ACP methyl ester carboxylesterase